MEGVYQSQIDHIINERLEKGEHHIKTEKSGFWGVAEEELVFEF